MPRLLGVDIPSDRPTVVSLTYLYGVGPKVARELCHKAGIDPHIRARELGEDEAARIAALLDKDYVGRGPVAPSDGSEHRSPSRHRLLSRHPPSSRFAGARTAHPHQRPTRKGPKKTVAGKKGVKDLK